MRLLRPTCVALSLCASFLIASCSGQDAESDQPAPKGGPPPVPAPVTLVARPDATGGEALYVQKCAMCHAPDGMGYGLLGRRAKDFEPNLEKRTDLTKNYVVLAARQGVGNMPAIPRGDVSDAELAQIADYLASKMGSSQ